MNRQEIIDKWNGMNVHARYSWVEETCGAISPITLILASMCDDGIECVIIPERINGIRHYKTAQLEVENEQVRVIPLTDPQETLPQAIYLAYLIHKLEAEDKP